MYLVYFTLVLGHFYYCDTFQFHYYRNLAAKTGSGISIIENKLMHTYSVRFSEYYNRSAEVKEEIPEYKIGAIDFCKYFVNLNHVNCVLIECQWQDIERFLIYR